ncbi:MAG: hypothetical protein EHM81_11705 [Chloroflexi bacterium]|nr:MAG: hypothetical protein EHM81_11705 [Chloroflexota bacterium]
MGTFFILLGIFLFVLFIMSDVADNTHFGYFCMGGASAIIAIFLKRTCARPAKPSNRFEGIRKWQQRQREASARREEAKKARQAKKK